MLEGDAKLKDIDTVHQLCLSWELPALNATNRKWLSEKLLLHAVNVHSALFYNFTTKYTVITTCPKEVFQRGFLTSLSSHI
ncbi:hypothetical protein JOQ06_007372 [Pogonophryne albipinna]|uniref:Uncharacterized protein n=1 Tax=Pogonophryne albipinna TaxID=1090488 RepID=A0AAD6B2R0_9TELE|nr:hypothetical protein JOQ06_007372 [Pogonophryne albipinna]